MREIIFYRTAGGKCPVEEFLDSLDDRQVTRILWVLRLIKELERIPKEYFKKLTSTDDIWEARISSGKNNYRILGFFDDNNFIILTNGFAKKSQKTPNKEILPAEQRKKDHLKRKE
jgi:phage-related protein